MEAVISHKNFVLFKRLKTTKAATVPASSFVQAKIASKPEGKVVRAIIVIFSLYDLLLNGF